jgi:predicted ATPase
MVNPRLYVITGGPGTGKTTLLAELAKLGFPHEPEVAREIIREQVAAGGTCLPWADREAYTRLMLRRSVESFRRRTPAPGPMLADRGIPDTLAYARLIASPRAAAIERVCRRYRYADLVFLTPPWREIYRTDDERKQDFDEVECTWHLLINAYRGLGYRLVEVPRLPPPDRARFVADRLSAAV